MPACLKGSPVGYELMAKILASFSTQVLPKHLGRSIVRSQALRPQANFRSTIRGIPRHGSLMHRLQIHAKWIYRLSIPTSCNRTKAIWSYLPRTCSTGSLEARTDHHASHFLSTFLAAYQRTFRKLDCPI